jgi:hypothetical protein
MLNWLLTLEEAVMLQTVSRLLPELPLFLMTTVVTHLIMSFAQTLMHYKLGHHPMGGKFFRNHTNFHHTYYSKDHLVSRTYRGDEGNNTPFFFIPVFLVGACTYLVLPIDLFVVQVVACAASFYAHVFFDKEYHVEGSRLQRFSWFRRKQELHFVHHRHANCNFAVIHFFWDRISSGIGFSVPIEGRMLGFVDKRDSQINWCLIQNRISSPEATLNQTPLGSPSVECLKS